MKPLPDWVKYTVFILIIVSFLAIMIILAIQKETDKLMALAGILVAICASNIFNVRAEIEKARALLELDIKRQAIFQDLEKDKQKELTANEKKHNTYKKMIFLLSKMLNELNSLNLDESERNSFNETYHKFFDFLLEDRIYINDALFYQIETIREDISSLDFETLFKDNSNLERISHLDQLKTNISCLRKQVQAELGLTDLSLENK